MTAPVGQSNVYHDLHVGSDHIQNETVLDSFLTDQRYTLDKQGGRGELSTIDSTDGNTYYVGGFMKSEAPGAGPETGEVRFCFNKDQEGVILDQLKKAGLIPEHIESFEELGPNAIGVIENAVETGVLEVNQFNELVVGSSSVDPEFAQGGAKNSSLIFEDGTFSTEAFHADGFSVYRHEDGSFHVQIGDDEPVHVGKDAYNAAGFTDGDPNTKAAHVAEAIKDGWIVYDSANKAFKPVVVTPSNGFPAFTPTPENTSMWSDPNTGETYRVMKDPSNANAFYIQKDNGEAVWVDSSNFHNAGFQDGVPTADDVAKAFRDGKLSFDGLTVTSAPPQG